LLVFEYMDVRFGVLVLLIVSLHGQYIVSFTSMDWLSNT
jgi:hypothetical protein